MQLNYDGEVDTLDVKYFAGSTVGYTLPLGVYELRDIILMIKSLFPKKFKVNITNDDIRLKSSLTNKTIRFTKRSFFYTILGFTRSHSGLLGDTDGFVQLISGTYKSDKNNNITRIDKNSLRADCFQGSIVNGIRKHILFFFGFSSPSSHELLKEPRMKLFK